MFCQRTTSLHFVRFLMNSSPSDDRGSIMTMLLTVLSISFWAAPTPPVAPHPLYLPHLPPCSPFLVPKMKFKLKGRRSDTVEEIQSHRWSFRLLESRTSREQCITVQGDKGEGGKIKIRHSFYFLLLQSLKFLIAPCILI